MSKPDTITVEVAAKLIMVSERRVQQLVAAKWITRPYTIVGVVQGYIKFLADEQRKVSRTVGEEEVRRERARKLRLGNDESERDLVRADDALAAMDAIVGVVKFHLAGISVQATDDIPARRKIEDAIDQVLSDMSGRLEKAGRALLAGRDALEAGGEDEPDAMGAGEPEVSAVGGEAGPA